MELSQVLTRLLCRKLFFCFVGAYFFPEAAQFWFVGSLLWTISSNPISGFSIAMAEVGTSWEKLVVFPTRTDFFVYPTRETKNAAHSRTGVLSGEAFTPMGDES